MEVLWRCCGGAVGACAPCALGCALPPPAPPTPSSARGVSAAALLSARRAQPRAGRGGRAGGTRSPVGGRRPRGAPRPPPPGAGGDSAEPGSALGRWAAGVRFGEVKGGGKAGPRSALQVNMMMTWDPPGGMKPFVLFWVCWATGPRKTPAAPAPQRPCPSPRPAAAVSSAPPPPCLGRRQPVRTRAASLSQCAPHLVGGGLKKLDPASIQLGTTASRRSLPGVPPPGSAPREGGGVGPPSLTSRHARQNARGVFPEGENRGRGARAGDRDLGTSRSPGWNASRVTPDAVNSGPPPPRRAALAPAVHPETPERERP